MRSTIRPVVCSLAVVIAVSACSDATAPANSATRAPAQPSYARGGGRSIPLGIPTTINLPGGAHFELGFSQLQGYIYMPINAAAFALAPHGLDLNGNPLP